MTHPFPTRRSSDLDLLKRLLKIRAKEINVASRLLARSDDLEMLAAGVRDELSILEGWRFEQFGRDAVDLVEGRMAFAVQDGKLRMTRTRGVAGHELSHRTTADRPRGRPTPHHRRHT